MNIYSMQNDDALALAIEGRLDTLTAPKLEDEIKNRIGRSEKLVLDLARLEYISSAGLRVLLWAHKMMSLRGGLKVINANEAVAEVFEVTGFNEILDIE